MSDNRKVVIIGNGVAGITTARHLRKNDSNVEIVVISAESKHFFSRTALMYVYMGHMQFSDIKPYEDWFWEKNRIDLVFDYVEAVDVENKSLKMKSGNQMVYDDLVIATGSKPRFFGWPGQDLDGVQGMVSLQDLESLERRTPPPLEGNKRGMKAVIVGGGLIGVELAEMLLTRDIPVTMLVREEVFWGGVLTKNEGERISQHLLDHGVDLRHGSEIEKINGDKGKVESVTTKSGDQIKCELVGITTGVAPNIGFLENTAIETDRAILVNENLETNIRSVYAVGDCAQIRNPRHGRRGLEPVWYVGRMMGEVLGQRLAGKEVSYLPGPWFNSAKFFDIEYQVYGNPQPTPDENQAHFFWEGAKNKFITVSYHPVTKVFQGISSFGIRLRHEYFDKALNQGYSVGEVIAHIDKANFDPEFYKKWPKDFKQAFEKETEIELPKTLLQKWMS